LLPYANIRNSEEALKEAITSNSEAATVITRNSGEALKEAIASNSEAATVITRNYGEALKEAIANIRNSEEAILTRSALVDCKLTLSGRILCCLSRMGHLLRSSLVDCKLP